VYSFIQYESVAPINFCSCKISAEMNFGSSQKASNGLSSSLRYTSTSSMLSLAKKFLGHVIPGVARPMHILWNQVIGFLFIVLAAIPVPSAIRMLNQEGSGPRLALTIPFILIMGWFGISSFWKARKIGKT
jgi:hypothetical protein